MPERGRSLPEPGTKRATSSRMLSNWYVNGESTDCHLELPQLLRIRRQDLVYGDGCSRAGDATGSPTSLFNFRWSIVTLRHPLRLCRTSDSHYLVTIPIPIFNHKHTMAPVQFFQAPGQYIRWASREKPAIFWSIVIGSCGPVIAVVAPPIRYRLGDGPIPRIPLTYPSRRLSGAEYR